MFMMASKPLLKSGQSRENEKGKHTNFATWETIWSDIIVEYKA